MYFVPEIKKKKNVKVYNVEGISGFFIFYFFFYEDRTHTPWDINKKFSPNPIWYKRKFRIASWETARHFQ